MLYWKNSSFWVQWSDINFLNNKKLYSIWLETLTWCNLNTCLCFSHWSNCLNPRAWSLKRLFLFNTLHKLAILLIQVTIYATVNTFAKHSNSIWYFILENFCVVGNLRKPWTLRENKILSQKQRSSKIENFTIKQSLNRGFFLQTLPLIFSKCQRFNPPALFLFKPKSEIFPNCDWSCNTIVNFLQ